MRERTRKQLTVKRTFENEEYLQKQHLLVVNYPAFYYLLSVRRALLLPYEVYHPNWTN